VGEDVARMPRAAFSQIVNRSMSEVLTRSLATTSCTLMPIIALLLFGGATLKDFAFALLIGVASGAYSSIFIASPVLTHWKEREKHYRTRRERIETEIGYVPAYADATADVEPAGPKRARRGSRITEPEPEGVSAAEFEQMKRELGIEEERTGGRQTSTLTKRLARHEEDDSGPAAAPAPAPSKAKPPRQQRAPQAQPAPPKGNGAAQASGADDDAVPAPAPDIAENEGIAPVAKDKRPSKSRSRNRRHGRRR
jgi:SecD/SecF fusion protein